MLARHALLASLLLSFCTAAAQVPAAPADRPAAPAFTNGLSRADFFPIGVWLQNPRNAPRYKAIGITLYVGLWGGPTDLQLAALEDAGMPVICAQNDVALRNRHRRIIVGWMHGDEPDNAQPLPNGQKGWGPPIAPEKIVEDYRRIHNADPTRPVILNLGQAVAWDNWVGRGVRSRHPEDYPRYVEGCDIASFDIYPAVHDNPEVAGNLWYVARGVERLRQWTEDRKPVWACIETTRISNPNVRPTPQQIHTEVWMALIHGARGIIYFAHQFQPTFVEAGLLADPQISTAVRNLNRRIQDLAPVLNSAPLNDRVSVASSNTQSPIALTVREHNGATFVFAVAMRNAATRGAFAFPAAPAGARVTVLSENRTLPIESGRWEDDFEAYGVHLYRISAPAKP